MHRITKGMHGVDYGREGILRTKTEQTRDLLLSTVAARPDQEGVRLKLRTGLTGSAYDGIKYTQTRNES